MDLLNQTFAQMDGALNQAFANQYVTAVVTIIIVVYGSMAAPELPDFLVRLFDFTLFKMLVLTLILLVNNYSPTVAIVMAVAFFLSLQTLSRYHLRQMAADVLSLRRNKADNEGEVEVATPEEVMDYNRGPDSYAQVSGMAARGVDYQGPQGMKHPVGFAEDALPGAEF